MSPLPSPTPAAIRRPPGKNHFRKSGVSGPLHQPAHSRILWLHLHRRRLHLTLSPAKNCSQGNTLRVAAKPHVWQCYSLPLSPLLHSFRVFILIPILLNPAFFATPPSPRIIIIHLNIFYPIMDLSPHFLCYVYYIIPCQHWNFLSVATSHSLYLVAVCHSFCA